MSAVGTELVRCADRTALSASARTALLLALLASLLTIVWSIESTFGIDRLGMRVVDVDILRRWVEQPTDLLAPFRVSFDRAPAIYELYEPFSWGDGAGYRLVNLALLAIAVVASQACFAPRSAAQAWAAGLAVCCNPFLLLISVGPSAEIPITTLLLAYFALPRRLATLPVHLLIVVVTFYVKDGPGLFLFAWLGIELVTAGRRRWPFALALVTLIALACSWRALESVHPAVVRITGYPDDLMRHMADKTIALLSRDSLDHPLAAFGMFWVRFVANAVSAGFRAPLFTTEGDVTLCGMSLGLNGIFIGAATITCCLQIRRAWRDGRAADATAAFPIFYATAVAAGVLFVQSRYLMPTLPIAIGSAAAPRSRFGQILFIVACGSIMMIAALELVGKPLPQVLPTSPDSYKRALDPE